MERTLKPQDIGTGPYTGLVFPPDYPLEGGITVHTWQCQRCRQAPTRYQANNVGELMIWKSQHPCCPPHPPQAD